MCYQPIGQLIHAHDALIGERVAVERPYYLANLNGDATVLEGRDRKPLDVRIDRFPLTEPVLPNGLLTPLAGRLPKRWASRRPGWSLPAQGRYPGR